MTSRLRPTDSLSPCVLDDEYLIVCATFSKTVRRPAVLASKGTCVQQSFRFAIAPAFGSNLFRDRPCDAVFPSRLIGIENP